MIEALTTYLLAAMLVWAPIPNRGEPEPASRARYESIARDVSAVAMDASEAPLFTGEGARAKTALTMLSVAFWETGFAANVDEGRCARGECDGGVAFSMWQLHPESGFVLDPAGYTYARVLGPEWIREHASSIVTARDIVSDRKTAARVALHIMRYSMRRNAGLCNFTGELTDGCPKARQRLGFALDWYATHPM